MNSRFQRFNVSESQNIIDYMNSAQHSFPSARRDDLVGIIDARVLSRKQFTFFIQLAALIFPGRFYLNIFDRLTMATKDWDTNGNSMPVHFTDNEFYELCVPLTCQKTIRWSLEESERRHHCEMDGDFYRWKSTDERDHVLRSTPANVATTLERVAWHLLFHGYPKGPALEPR